MTGAGDGNRTQILGGPNVLMMFRLDVKLGPKRSKIEGRVTESNMNRFAPPLPHIVNGFTLEPMSEAWEASTLSGHRSGVDAGQILAELQPGARIGPKYRFRRV
jgi:hypothetical protein